MLYYYIDLEYLVKDKFVVLNLLLLKFINNFFIKFIINFESREVFIFNGKVDLFVEELNWLKYNGYKIILVINILERVNKLGKDLLDKGLEMIIFKDRDIEIKFL